MKKRNRKIRITKKKIATNDLEKKLEYEKKFKNKRIKRKNNKEFKLLKEKKQSINK